WLQLRKGGLCQAKRLGDSGHVLVQPATWTPKRLQEIRIQRRKRGIMAATTRANARRSTKAERSPRCKHVTTCQELRSAAQIQHQLLPPSLYTGRYVDVAAKAHPCRIIGGDFFDYQDTGHQFRLALGDVCGNG